MSDNETVEKQYGLLYEVIEKHGIAEFGLMANESWNQDPKRTLFTLSRYKFVGKMLNGRGKVLEVGCADAFGTRIVQQHVSSVTAIDIDPLFVEDAAKRLNPHWPMDLAVHNMLSGPYSENFDAAFSLDVLEHIQPEYERAFISNIVKSLASNSLLIIGIPSLESQTYASPQSKEGHVNCKTGSEFKKLMENYFDYVLMFSMNDEVVHTGFDKMAHYLFAVCCNPNPVSDQQG